MAFLRCKKCNFKYELKPNERAIDFECCSKCGGELVYDKVFVDDPHGWDVCTDVAGIIERQKRRKENKYKKPSSSPTELNIQNIINKKPAKTKKPYVRDSISTGKTYTEKKAAQYQKKRTPRKRNPHTHSNRKKSSVKNTPPPKKISSNSSFTNRDPVYMGISLAIIIGGIFLTIISFNALLLILIPIGIIIYMISPFKPKKSKKPYKSYQKKRSKRKAKTKSKSNSDNSWAKGLHGENTVFKYLNTLPKDYYVFHDVTLPKKKGNIDHVVIGPNGVFVIETKNYSGKFCIKYLKWYYFRNGEYRESKYNPVPQLLNNKNDLNIFLDNRRINTNNVTLTPIVAFVNPDFKIMGKSAQYEY